MRIVSLLPSATEIVCELGLRKHLVGVTHECDFPSSVEQLPAVTETLIPRDAASAEIDRLVREQRQNQNALYRLREDVLLSLQPDLIVTQALCDVCAVAEAEVERVAQRLPHRPHVVNLAPTRLAEVFDCMTRVGAAADIPHQTREIVGRLQDRVEEVRRRSESIAEPPKVLLLEWIDPPFCAGHWSPELVRLAGGKECFGREGETSTTTTWDEIAKADPEVMVIACCGFTVPRTIQDIPLMQNRPEYRRLRCVRDERVYVIDGNAYFNRPGPRLVDSLEILAHTLHPHVHALPEHLRPATRIDHHGSIISTSSH